MAEAPELVPESQIFYERQFQRDQQQTATTNDNRPTVMVSSGYTWPRVDPVEFWAGVLLIVWWVLKGVG